MTDANVSALLNTSSIPSRVLDLEPSIPSRSLMVAWKPAPRFPRVTGFRLVSPHYTVLDPLRVQCFFCSDLADAPR